MSKEKQLEANPDSIVFVGVFVIDNVTENKIAEIDNLRVIDGDHGLVLAGLVEAKAGDWTKGRLTTEFSNKVKSLKKAREGEARILYGKEDITSRFDFSSLDDMKKTATGPGEAFNTKLDPVVIAGINKAIIQLKNVGYDSLYKLGI